MARRRRSDHEIRAAREKILDEALILFADAGWEGFSMRKLGARLGIAAKTLYNYFDSQDELYLRLLIRGFRHLRASLASAAATHSAPWDRLAALVETYVYFGFENANLYNLMFLWHVPKYDDYVGTALEGVALVELEAALDNQRLIGDTLVEYLGHPVDEDDLRFATIRIWTQIHGYVAGVNSNVIDYMHPDPGQLRTRMVEHLQLAAAAEVVALAERSGAAVPVTLRPQPAITTGRSAPSLS